MSIIGQKRKRTPLHDQTLHPTPRPQHPYLSGNFAPIQQTLPLTSCTYIGKIPPELADGEYVRNGSNPVTNEDLGRDAHWFDGDGMLSGVSFRKDDSTGEIQPEFVNQFVLTDLYLSAKTSGRLRVPILPSIATLVNPVASFIYVTLRILRTVLLVILSHLPGSKQKIKKISVANTNVIYHDGRALATCESGPPMRISLPGLETIGWYNGAWADGEPRETKAHDEQAKGQEREKVLGGDSGLISFMREWTTAHPKVDPKTKEMLMFHSSFAPPFVQYSIIPQTPSTSSSSSEVNAVDASQDDSKKKLLNAAVPGIHGAKMMHDFGVSATHTVIMDLPLTLDPMNQLKGLPPVAYESHKPSRFGVFPRRRPESTRWFETDASCIFHTANTWDDVDTEGKTTAVNMLACRLTSATMIFASGNIAPPAPPPQQKQQQVDTSRAARPAKRRMPFFSKYNEVDDGNVYERTALLESPSVEDETKEAFIVDTDSLSLGTTHEPADPFVDEQCRLYYYSFSLDDEETSEDSTTTAQLSNSNSNSNSKSKKTNGTQKKNTITHQWALSALPFEFPSVRPDREMSSARYVYGCSTTTTTTFGSALGKATKIDALVKMDTETLIARGRANPPRSVTGVVDGRSMAEVLESASASASASVNSEDSSDDDDEEEGKVDDPIKVFRLPEGWFAQEPRFVPASPSSSSPQSSSNSVEQSWNNKDKANYKSMSTDAAKGREDAGYLLFYVFNEAQLLPSGDCPPDSAPDSSPNSAADSARSIYQQQRAKSELWILDARDMETVVARIYLPQRVPYGLHGAWFDAEQVRGQRPVETTRSLEKVLGTGDEGEVGKEKSQGVWMAVREMIEGFLG